jgi:predicted Zn finger-like uncharacterized protein
MTAVTQCPQCGTRFRVVPDQLKISNGWVRCGKCAEVFNAQGALETAAALKAGQPAPVHTGTAPQQVSIVLRQQEPVSAGSGDLPPVPAQEDDGVLPGSTLADESPAEQGEHASVPSDDAQAETPWRRDDDHAHAHAHAHAHEPDHSAQPPVVAEPQQEVLSDTTQAVPSWLIRRDIGQRVDIDWAAVEATDDASADVRAVTNEPMLPVTNETLPAVPLAVAVSALQQTVAGWVRSDEPALPTADTPHVAEAQVSDVPVSAQPVAAAAQVPPELDEAIQLSLSSTSLDIELPVDPLVQAVPGADSDLNGSVGRSAWASPNQDPEPQADVGFIRQARRQAAWASGPARAALGALIMFAAALLLLQVAVHERDRLVAMAPALKPWLVQLCEPIGCDIAPFQYIEAVEIVSTELVRAKDGTYRFELGLRNNAVLPVAMPAVELSLTDRTGDAVVRRVVLPDDWVDAPVELNPTSEIGLTLKMSLVNPDELRMEGFRAVVFYP